MMAKHPQALFWSKRGEVECGAHAPEVDSEQWQSEGWCTIPSTANVRHTRAYQCPVAPLTVGGTDISGLDSTRTHKATLLDKRPPERR